MFNFSTLTFLAVFFASVNLFAQGLQWPSQSSHQPSSSSMTQNQWKQVLGGLKSGNSTIIQSFSIDKGTFRVQGPGTSGGGNESDAEFFYLANQIFNDFTASRSATHGIAEAKQALQLLKSEKSVFFTDRKLVLDGKEKAAINDYDVFVIVFNETRWNDSTFSQKRRLILHELLGLARKFDSRIDDSSYELSNQAFNSLDEANQKDFLKKSEFPKNFEAPKILNFSAVSNQNLVFSENGKTQVCSYLGNEPSVRVITKTIESEGKKQIDVFFRITCRKENGEIFGFSHGGDSEALVDIVSGNLLQIKNDFGIFNIGWISGESLFGRTPVMVISLIKTSQGSFEFLMESKENGSWQSVRGMLKP